MIQNIGIPGLILLLVIALIIFGPSKLPEIGRAFGSTLKEFKKSTRDLISNDDDSREHNTKEQAESYQSEKEEDPQKNTLVKMNQKQH